MGFSVGASSVGVNKVVMRVCEVGWVWVCVCVCVCVGRECSWKNSKKKMG